MNKHIGYRGIFVGLAIAVSVGMLFPRLLAADPSVKIESLAASAPADAPVIPWVAVGDKSWMDAKPLFDITDAKDPARSAKGWMAVTTQGILVHVVVHHIAHLSSSGGANLWSGDAIQFGIDPLGFGAAQPALTDIDAALTKHFGATTAPAPTPNAKGKITPKAQAAADQIGKNIQNARNYLQRQNNEITNGDMFRMCPEDEDFCVGSDTNGKSEIFTFYSGHRRPGAVVGATANVVRDDQAQTTTYDADIPWSEFGLQAGLSPVMKVSFQINNSNGALGKQNRIYWGGGVGGRFAPWKFQTVTIAPPPADVHLAAIAMTKSYVDGPDDYVEAYAVVSGSAASLAGQIGGALKSQDVPATGVNRYSIKAYPGPLHGSASFTATLTNSNGASQTVNLRVFDDSVDDWYVFAPKNDFSPGIIGLNDWLDKPAGSHGFVTMKGENFVCEDGTPIKFWGVGRHGDPTPDKQRAIRIADWYAKMGVNGIRHCELLGEGWAGIGSQNDTTKQGPVMLDRCDFFFSELRKRGIYYNVSAFWANSLKPADRAKVLNFDEAKNQTVGLENFAPDIQDLHIAAVVNFLNHKNPYTGLRYADDAALSGIEMQNESDIYWYSTQGAMLHCPTYRKVLSGQFCDWLTAKYGTEENLEKAWAARAINGWPKTYKTIDESLANRNILPVFGAWFFSPEGLADQEAHLVLKRRLLDTAEFMHEVQNKFYSRFAAAIRATGYKGALNGSDWQAGSGVSNLYNIRSDALVGVIDRHDYFGGTGAMGVMAGPQDNSAMISVPGSDLLSTGFQQVIDRPFGLSEWETMFPNEWTAEGSAILGIYGMGLQGWDYCYESFGHEPGYSPSVDAGSVWNFNLPTHAGLCPAIARMIMRGDVTEAPVYVDRKVSLDQLRSGDIPFNETIVQAGDIKEIHGAVPSEALAIGRVVAEFTDKSEPFTPPDFSQYIHDKVVTSTTGQLQWHYPSPEESFITVNTPGTKALVGFIPKQEFTLGNVKMQVDNKFATVFVTALGRHENLDNAKTALITVIARTRNTGMTYDAARMTTSVGHAPILMEPIFGTITFTRKIAAVYLLDHDGLQTQQTIPVTDGKITLDGARDKTLYYEVMFGD